MSENMNEARPLNEGNNQGAYGAYSGGNMKSYEEENRRNFIKKVYGILAVQLSITVFFTSLVVTNDDLRDAIEDTFAVVIVCMVLTVVISLVIVCVPSAAKRVPMNYILLLMFTLCETYIVAFICAYYDSEVVLIAALLTLGITVALTAYAWTTKYDFTTLGGVIWVLVISMFLFGFLTIFYYNQVLNVLYCTLGVILYGIFLVYDTQLITGGRYRSIGYDDYIVGSLLLYIDIVGIFLYVLSLLGNRN